MPVLVVVVVVVVKPNPKIPAVGMPALGCVTRGVFSKGHHNLFDQGTEALRQQLLKAISTELWQVFQINCVVFDL